MLIFTFLGSKLEDKYKYYLIKIPNFWTSEHVTHGYSKAQCFRA